jgi:ribosomal protein S18 acetylase RimI-like enzyme
MREASLRMPATQNDAAASSDPRCNESATTRNGEVLSLPEEVVLRPMTDADLPFLEQVYASTRTDELAQTDWSEAQKSQFIAFQFQAQHQHYRTHYHDAQFFVIERAGVDVGRLYLHWRTDELRIVDIALLPEARGHGLGNALLVALMQRAADAGKSVSIHVEQMNPAMRLYRRLGFEKIGEHGIYHLMQWNPDAT